MEKNKFRGKRTDNKEWVFGHFLKHDDASVIQFDNSIGTEVIPETVGQYIGLLDKKGTGIYENDIYDGYCEYEDGILTQIISNRVVEWMGSYLGDLGCGYHLGDVDYVIVVGNIHDNPELKGKQ